MGDGGDATIKRLPSRIAEVDKMPPWLYINLTDHSASFEQFLAHGSRVLNHHLQTFERAGLHRREAFAKSDRTGGALRSQLNKAQVPTFTRSSKSA